MNLPSKSTGPRRPYQRRKGNKHTTITPLSDTEKEYIRARIKAGDSYKEIARKLSRGTATIRHISKKEELRGRQRSHKALRELGPDLENIKSDYEDLKLTTQQIADKYNVSKPTIQRLARRFNWKGPYHPQNPTKLKLDRFIRKRYVLRNYSTKQIKNALRTLGYELSEEYIRDRLIKMGVERRDRSSKNVKLNYYRYKDNQPRITGRQITKFIKQNQSKMKQSEMARALGIDRATLNRRLKALNITLPTASQKVLNNINRIKWEYENTPITINELEKEYGISAGTISKHLKELGTKITRKKRK